LTHIATTHVGSLPRGPELTPLLLARDHGEPYDSEVFDRTVQSAVDEAVVRQVHAGVSVVRCGKSYTPARQFPTGKRACDCGWVRPISA